MANHGAAGGHSAGMEEHVSTYEGFLKGAVALTLACLFILVALVSFGFGHSLNVFIGFAGLILGLLAIAIDARAGGRWLLSIGLLVVFGLITAVNVA
jgi:type IV secretory pathway VirB2 component (pilin)